MDNNFDLDDGVAEGDWLHSVRSWNIALDCGVVMSVCVEYKEATIREMKGEYDGGESRWSAPVVITDVGRLLKSKDLVYSPALALNIKRGCVECDRRRRYVKKKARVVDKKVGVSSDSSVGLRFEG